MQAPSAAVLAATTPNEPGAHPDPVHVPLPFTAANVPGVHAVQVAAPADVLPSGPAKPRAHIVPRQDVEPVPVENWPLGQRTQVAAAALVAAGVSEYQPALHAVPAQVAEPGVVECWPPGQGVQVCDATAAAEDCPVVPVEKNPAGQGVPVHVSDPATVLYVRAGQGEHVAVADVVELPTPNCPGGHAVPPAHEVAPTAVDHLPLPHGTHLPS